MKSLFTVLFLLITSAFAFADGCPSGWGRDVINGEAVCIAPGTDPAPQQSSLQESASWTWQSSPPEVDKLPSNRPANITASTTDGFTTISWVKPLNLDREHCNVHYYNVDITRLRDGKVVYESWKVFYPTLVTTHLSANNQYLIEVVSYSDECDEWSEPGVFTYQY